MAALIALAALAVAWLLVLAGRRLRRRRGLADAATLDLDTRTLVSRRYGLIGRPDRLIREGGFIIPEEWKSSHRLQAWHVAQLGVYFLLVEEHYRRRPPYGYVVYGDGLPHRIENSGSLRADVIGLADRIRSARRAVREPIPVRPPASRCRPCGVRQSCGQARA